MKSNKRILGVIASICLMASTLAPVSSFGATVITEKPELTIYVGNVRNLNPGPEIRGKRTWTSSNKKVVSVATRGIITAKKAGTADITVANGKVTQTCKITVVPVHMKEEEATVQAGKKLKLKLYCGTNKGITWESSDPSVLSYSSDTGSKSKWIARKAGTVTVTATYLGNAYTTLVKVEPKNVPIEGIPQEPDTVLPEV